MAMFEEKRKDPSFLRSRIRGCLLAGALGDALGYTVEFTPYRSIQATFGSEGIRALVPNYTGKAIVSDDTQMTLFTCDAMLPGAGREEQGLTIAERIHRAYLCWLQTQDHYFSGTRDWESPLNAVLELNYCRAPGNTCLYALRSGKMGTLDQPINDSKGCGGVMRSAPLGFDPRWGEPLMTGAQSGAITHGHPMGWVPAGMLSDIVNKCIYGEYASLRAVIEASLADTKAAFGDKKGFADFEEMVTLAMELSETDAPDEEAIRRVGEGWVGDEALAVAIYSCLRHPEDLRECLISSVNHSGDSDSTGAVAGNILGAWLGDSALPEDWIAQLELVDVMDGLADSMVCVLTEA